MYAGSSGHRRQKKIDLPAHHNHRRGQAIHTLDGKKSITHRNFRNNAFPRGNSKGRPLKQGINGQLRKMITMDPLAEKKDPIHLLSYESMVSREEK